LFKKFITIVAPLVLASAAFAQSVVVPAQAFFPTTGYAPVVQATYSAFAQTATITTFNVQCPAASNTSIATTPQAGIQPITPAAQSGICPAGVYRISVFNQNTAGTSGGGTVTNTVGYHTSATAQTANTAGTLTETTGLFVTGSYVFRSDGTLNITFATSQSSSGSYDISFTLERLM
jgi:hypothetical protein